MRRKGRKNGRLVEPPIQKPRMKDETRHGIAAVLWFVVTIALSLALFGLAGPVGEKIFDLATKIVGKGFIFLPLATLALASSYLKKESLTISSWRLACVVAALLSALGLLSLIAGEGSAGIVGAWITRPLLSLFDYYLSLIILAGILIIATLILFETHLSLDLSILGFPLFRKRDESDEAIGEEGEIIPAVPMVAPIEEVRAQARPEREPSVVDGSHGELGAFSGFTGFKGRARAQGFTPPPIDLLEGDSGKPGVGDIKANANIIKRTLANFGIIVEMDEISIGPSITRYALKPAEGVKLARIVALQNDLSLALAAHPIRIEAPIPGKSLVGIEIPNTSKIKVGMASLIGSKEFAESHHPLLISLGRAIAGTAHFANLGKAPHLLVAGATGSGKSVSIHSIITSLLYRNPPDRLRFIMVDPKRVELTVYNHIPHLLTPVITDAKKTIMALRWAAKEMDRRYDILEKEAVRDIESYHKGVVEPAYAAAAASAGKPADDDLPDRMPYIVVIIDELADIMSTYPREMEAGIVRLAQMSRAVGIHLLLSTQRPSVEIITGLIKANIPSRIALQVASQIDSRTILDMAGAEKLLGSGDMLYLSGDMSKPIRLQSAFISEREVKQVVAWLKDHYRGEVPQDISIGAPAEMGGGNGGGGFMDEGGDADDDDLYEEARAIVMQAGKASASYLQRRLKVGYARAARLLDMLEERNVIGPADGAKPREIMDRSAGSSGGGESNA